MKKLLLISYAFPPAVTGGTWRPFKFAKYLPEFDIKVDVFTTHIGNYQNEDFSLLQQLKNNVTIYRVKSPLQKKSTDKFRTNLDSGLGDEINKKKLSFMKKLLIFIRNNILIPDVAILWSLKILPKLILLIYRQKYDVILVTSPPYSILVLGMWLKFFTKTNLIVDYRDPWTQWFSEVNKNESKLRKYFGIWMEKRIIKKSDSVICTTPSMTNYLKNKIKNTTYNKFFTLYNGVDPDDFRNIPVLRFKKKTILYTGLLNEAFYSPKNFFKVLWDINKNSPKILNNFQFIVLGQIDPVTVKLIKEYDLSDKILLKGSVPHKSVIEHLLGADLLLLILNPGVTDYCTISGKLYEYIYSKKEILALIPKKSAAGEILIQYSKATIIHPNEFDNITEYIRRWLSKPVGVIKIKKEDDELINRFNRKKQALKLSEIINKLD